MKLKDIKKATLLLLAVPLCAGFTACSDDDTVTYDNKAFVTTEKVNTILVKGSTETAEGVIKTAIAKPEQQDVTVTYAVNLSGVKQYNEEYGADAVALPTELYTLENPTSTIAAGALQGSDVLVHFQGLNNLDRDLVYVLPVTVKSSNFEVLRSAKTAYFVFKGGALVNTTADITKNYLSLKSGGMNLNGMHQITVECLVNVSKFEKLISTIMGIEGRFLIRIGDAGVPDNQIQLATSNGNVTDAAWTVPTNEWVHIAVTFNNETGATDVFINGVHKGSTQRSRYTGSVNWGNDDFYIGRSYDNNRWLEGQICEARIWKRILTPEEINAKNHFFGVDPKSEDLAAYWKFDEGAGSVIVDHTGNGNDLSAASAPTWRTVSLPEKK